MINGAVLINAGTDIYIPLEINNIIKEKYIFKNILRYVNGEKRALCSSTHLVFEYIKDFGDPIEDWFPFLYQNWVSTEQYETFFCFFNVEYLAAKA